MTQCWDYFMRRKTCLLPIMALFLCSSLFSFGFLCRHQFQLPQREIPATYISVNISDPEDSQPDVPDTANTPEDTDADTSEDTSANAPENISAPEDADTPEDVPETIEVPHTGGAPAPLVLSPDSLPRYEQPNTTPTPLPSTPSPAPASESRTLPVVALLISSSIVCGFWLYFLYEHYTR